MDLNIKSANKKLTYSTDLFYIDIFHITSTTHQASKVYPHSSFHKHPYFEICYVLSGNCEFELYNKKIFTVQQNSFIIFPPTCEHRIIKESELFSKLFAFFSFVPQQNKDNMFYKSARIAANDVNIYNSNRILKFYVNRFIDIFKDGEYSDYDTAITANFLSFIIEIFKIITKNGNPAPTYIHNDKRINDAIAYINSNITNAPSVENVAKFLHISTKQLTRIFNDYLSISPGKYIKKLKIEKIKRLLMNMDYTLSDIAEIMKYNDASALIRFFQENEGITPQKMRENIFKLQ